MADMYPKQVSSLDYWLADPVTNRIIGVQSQSPASPNVHFIPVYLTAGQIASPTAAMIADTDSTFALNVAPYTRYISNGTTLVTAGGSGAAGLGANTFTGNQTISGAALITSGNISAATWGGAAVSNITGVLLKGTAAILTDTTAATGTTAVIANSILGGNTLAASNTGVIYTNAFELYVKDPVAGGTNVTMTNKWALGADSLRIGATNPITITSTGLLTITAGGITVTSGNSNFSGNFQVDGASPFGSRLWNGGILGWSSSSNANGTTDAGWGRLSTANIRQGLAPSGTPIAQTYTLGESSIAGTSSNIGGANGTIRPGLGTGSGTLAKLLLQGVVTQGGGATMAQTYATAISINDTTSTGLQFNGYGAGALSTDASGNITATSARAAKEEFRNFDYGLETIQKISPQWWKWKKETNLDRSREYGGFIADDIVKLIPELSGHGDPLQYVLAACVNAIKELERRIT